MSRYFKSFPQFKLWAVVTLGFALGIGTSTWAFGETRAGHSVSTTPQRVNGGSLGKTTETLVVTRSELTVPQLKAKLGNKVTLRKIAAGIEVKGVPAGQLATVVYSLTSGEAHITRKGKQVRARALGATELSRLNSLNEKFVRYGLSRNFGQSQSGGTGGTLGGSVYPVPKCWKMTCSDCGPAPQGGIDCSELERQKDAAYDAYMKAAASQEIWQAALQAFKDMEFYGGVAGMIGDMVNAATTVLSAGSASGASQAAAKLLIQMARDGVLEALMEEVGIPGLSDMTEGAVQSKLAAAEAARVAAAKALEEARKKWVECMNTPGAMTPAQLQVHKQAVTRYDGCRYRVHMGEPPECEMKEAACP